MTRSSDTRAIPKTAALILAGGEGRRMGGNKPFREVGGMTLLARVIKAARTQCDHVMISSNEDTAIFAENDVPVVRDLPKAGQGPLGGVLGGLDALPGDIDWLVSFPVDCPIVPDDMVAQLLNGARNADVKAAFASHADRDHYLSSIWHRGSAPVIARQLADDNRRVGAALRVMDAAKVTFPVSDGVLEPFTNVNSPEDLNALHKMLSGFVGGKGG
ncbi:molybdenum cofactor guanylyltransferase MobA [Thalassospira lohafexi]|uniref:Molybdenum cofactor guanylyltransferase n=1 Tax=Thalassospira lohafexi TaxID=744227 RepID=A0A2N3L708_9PROT|nr:molybdenum cofactor guanylyltransferase MobA [Thalassospira lohafexi]PKR58605.1 molybdenum cofactor guanylyltransferase [Thalassospira lohafexi]